MTTTNPQLSTKEMVREQIHQVLAEYVEHHLERNISSELFPQIESRVCALINGYADLVADPVDPVTMVLTRNTVVFEVGVYSFDDFYSNPNQVGRMMFAFTLPVSTGWDEDILWSQHQDS